MAIKGKKKNKKIGGKNEEVYVVEFNNGTYKQLKELLEFLKCEGINIKKLEDVISLGIGWIERVKSEKNKSSESKVKKKI